MIILGIDPANVGACVLVLDGVVINTWSWIARLKRKKNAGYEIIQTILSGESVSKTEFLVKSAGGIAEIIANGCAGVTDLHIACEDAYIGQNPRSGLSVARMGGAIIGGVTAVIGDANVSSTCLVGASSWRAAIHGFPARAKRDVCKEQSLLLIPKIAPSIESHLGGHGMLDHITDALGVAIWRSYND